MVLLVAVGCSGSAQKGASYAIDYMRSLRGADVVTPIPGPATEEQRAARADAFSPAFLGFRSGTGPIFRPAVLLSRIVAVSSYRVSASGDVPRVRPGRSVPAK